MQVTIVKEDNTVVVDGVARAVDCSSLPAGVHAVQWDGESKHGEVEFIVTRCPHCSARSKRGNALINDFTPYQVYVDAWQKRVGTDVTGPQS